MITYEKTLHALSHGTRRRLFELLGQRPRSVGELAEEVPVSQPAVSQHLKVLREANLVEVEPKGARHIYRVRREGLEALRAYVESLWEDVLEAFAGSQDPPEEERR